jgi:hypothetical protein
MAAVFLERTVQCVFFSHHYLIFSFASKTKAWLELIGSLVENSDGEIENNYLWAK